MPAMKPRAALLACLTVILAVAVVAEADEAVDITYAGGLLTIRCAGAELADVLDQVGSAVGMALVLDDGVKLTVVTADIEAQPVQVALELLLEGRGFTYAMSLSPDGQKVAKMYVGGGAEAKSASAADGRRPPDVAAASPRGRETVSALAASASIATPATDDDDEVDMEEDEPSPFAGLGAETASELSPSPPAVAGAAPKPPAVKGTPPVPMMLPGSSQPYYPVLDPFGLPIPMPRPSPAPPVDQRPGAVVQ